MTDSPAQRIVPHISVRLRPLTDNEADAGDQNAWLTRSQSIAVKAPPPKPQHDANDSVWAFDAVFGPECGNPEVYASTCAHLVGQALRGFNSLALCYGPTGAGKTYTMGALMRSAAHDIFQHIRQSNSSFLLRFSAAELYNEVVTDMLAASKDGEAPSLRVLENPERGGPSVEGLSEVVILGEEHAEELFKRVEACRHVRETRQNAASSRSHQIVRIVVESRGAEHTASAPGFVSTMHFVDLCGSERLSQVTSMSVDDEKLRQKETSNINRSLLTLGTVIRALGDPGGRKHVPYRDSKLTRILQSALSGNAAMAIITTLSPATSSVENSKAALHFASAAKKIVLAPQINTVTDDSQSVIRRMQAEIDFLRRQMRAAEAAEVEGWKTKVEEKDEHLRKAAEEKVALEKRLKNMERLILSGQSWGQGPMAADRYSDANINIAALDLPTVARSGAHEGGGGASAGGAEGTMRSARRPRHPAAAAVRASWDPRSVQSAGGEGSGAAAMQQQRLSGSRPAAQVPQLSFLDFFKSHARKASGSATHDASKQQAMPKLDLTKVAISKLEGPKGQQADEALAALQAEVRCIAAANGSLSTDAKQGLEAAIEHLAAGVQALETEVAAMASSQAPESAAKLQVAKSDLEAMRCNLQRLLDRQKNESRAASALAALSQKLHPRVVDEEEEGADPCFNAIPAWMQEMFDNELDAAAAGSPTDGACTMDVPPLSSRQPMSTGPRPVNRYDADEDEAECDSGMHATPASKVTKRASQAGTGDAGDTRQLDQVGLHQAQAGARPAVSDMHSEGPTASGLTDIHTPGSSGYDVSSTGRQGAGSCSRPGSGLRRWNTVRVQGALRKQKEAVVQWYRSELARVQAELKASASADVAAVREALEQYKEQADRLETQKALLLHQVLKLELGLEEENEAKAGLQHQIHKLMCERDQARFEAVQSKAAARAAAAAAASVQAMAAQAEAERDVEESTPVRSPPERLSFFDEVDEEWDKETPENLMTAILTLWHELHIPLTYRSRFFLGFKGKELFYFELEHRRLEWQRSQHLAGGHKERDKAARALEWERKSLAQSLKYAVDDASRELLFREWGVPVTAKERKLQLVHKLWHPRTLEQPDGAARSAEMVVALTGTDATEQFMQLIFGGTKALQPKPINVLVQNLVNRVSNGAMAVSTPRGRQRSPGQTPPGVDVMASGGGSNAGRPPLTPRRSSFGNMLAGLGIGSKRPPGVPSLSPLPPQGGGILAQLGLTPRGARPQPR